jgi:hypothetical protein
MNNTNFTTKQIRDNIFYLVKEKDVLVLNTNGIPFELEWWGDRLPVEIENVWDEGSTIVIEFNQSAEGSDDGYYEGWIENYELLVEKEFLENFLKR